MADIIEGQVFYLAVMMAFEGRVFIARSFVGVCVGYSSSICQVVAVYKQSLIGQHGNNTYQHQPKQYSLKPYLAFLCHYWRQK